MFMIAAQFVYDFTLDRRKSQPTVKWLSSMAQFSEWLFINLGKGATTSLIAYSRVPIIAFNLGVQLKLQNQPIFCFFSNIKIRLNDSIQCKSQSRCQISESSAHIGVGRERDRDRDKGKKRERDAQIESNRATIYV